jgi:hypothetical protein
MKITIELENGVAQEISFSTSELLVGVRKRIGHLDAEMRKHLEHTSKRDHKLLSNFIRGKLTAYQEINAILSEI